MSTSSVRAPARIAFLFALAASLVAGCASMDSRPPAAQAAAVQTAPAAPTISGFSPALRCMDGLLADYGTRDVSVIVEDLADPTQRNKAGTREMLVAVVSDMTQRSRAIRLVASGKDWGNTVNYLAEALKREAFAVVPQYALRGSISQVENGSGTVLGLDLTMLTTHDMSVVPGIATRNSVLLSRGGNAEIRKFGHNFNLATRSGEGQGQAMRALVELAAIELFGRLARVPYWTCLGTTDAQETVAGEIQDWYDAMAARQVELIKYFQGQMRLRRAYEGPLDGSVSPEFKDAVVRYREALGLSAEPKLSLEFFKAYLGADHRQIEARLAPPAAAAVPVAAAPSAAVAPIPAAVQAAPAQPALTLRIAAANNARQFARGEAVRLTIQPSRDAHVYCFLQDEKRQITRFFPNRFQRDSRVQQDQGLQVPGAMRFEIFMNPRGIQETVSCFATERDVLAQLPAGVNGVDFDPLPVANLDQVRNAFVKVTGGAVGQESFLIRAK